MLIAKKKKSPYKHFILLSEVTESFLSIGTLLCIISIYQIPHTLKPSYLFKSDLKTQEPLKPLIVKSSIWSLTVTTDLVQTYIQNLNENLKHHIASYSQKTKKIHRLSGA